MPDGTRRDRFAEFHVSKTRSYIDRTMASGQDIFPVMQACTLLSWYFYQEGRWVEVWKEMTNRKNCAASQLQLLGKVKIVVQVIRS